MLSENKYLNLQNQVGGSVIITLKTLNGHIIMTTLESLDISIIELKCIINSNEHFSQYSQEIIFNGKQLLNDDILSEKNPENNIMYLTIKIPANPAVQIPDIPIKSYEYSNKPYYIHIYNIEREYIRYYYEKIIAIKQYERFLKKYDLTIGDINILNKILNKIKTSEEEIDLNLIIDLGKQIFNLQKIKNDITTKAKLIKKKIDDQLSHTITVGDTVPTIYNEKINFKEKFKIIGLIRNAIMRSDEMTSNPGLRIIIDII